MKREQKIVWGLLLAAILYSSVPPIYAAVESEVLVNGQNTGKSTSIAAPVRIGGGADNSTNAPFKLAVIPTTANAANPSWTEGRMAPLSVDLTGALRTTGTGCSNCTVNGDKTPADNFANPATAMNTNSLNSVFDGTAWDRQRSADVLDTGLTAGIQASHNTLVHNAAGTFTSVNQIAEASNRTTSAADTANAVTLDIRNLHDTLSIHSACSAGTAAVTIESSVDNTNFLLLETVAAAATVVKLYTATTAGATIAISPLSFRYLRVTTATCGAANTSVLTVAVK